jgi:hypothetical protein
LDFTTVLRQTKRIWYGKRSTSLMAGTSYYFSMGAIYMREGILIPDLPSGRAGIRFNSDACYGGLHCGTTMDIWLNDQWLPTRIEMDSRGWFLAGVQVETLWGQRVRIPW